MFQHTLTVWVNSQYVRQLVLYISVNNLYLVSHFALAGPHLPLLVYVLKSWLFYICRLSCSVSRCHLAGRHLVWEPIYIRKFWACLFIISHRATGISRKYKNILCTVGWWWGTSRIKGCTTCRTKTAGAKVFITRQGLAPTYQE